MPLHFQSTVNITTFKIRYKCDEFPRNDEPLEDADIRNITLTREIQGNLEIRELLYYFP